MTLIPPPTDFAEFIRSEREQTLASYRARPDNIRENAGQEQGIVQGGYAGKQIQELVQNAIDALRERPGEIRVVLSDRALYVANDGLPFSREGVQTILHSYMSDKRGEEIGRFGLGFKSVLEVSTSPQIYTGAWAFGFDAERSRNVLAQIRPGLSTYPVLRLPYTLNEDVERAADPILAELLDSSVTVIKLPLHSGVRNLPEQIREFPPEFMLFSDCVTAFTVEIRGSDDFYGRWTAERQGDSQNLLVARLQAILGETTEENLWVVASHAFSPSEAARADAGTLHSRDTVRVSWAIPFRSSGRKTRGQVWNHFPTGTSTSLPGIINAAFKMNDDRMTLLQGPYNFEILSECVPDLVARALPMTFDSESPGAHLDNMPARGREDDRWFRAALIDPITKRMARVPIAPDLTGKLQLIRNIRVRPATKQGDEDSLPIQSWTQHALAGGTAGWLHEAVAGNKDRAATIDRLMQVAGTKRATIEEWITGLGRLGRPLSYQEAILFAAEYVLEDGNQARTIQAARIVPMADGHIGRLGDSLYFPAGTGRGDYDPGLVDKRLLDRSEVVNALKDFGAQPLDDRAHLEKDLKKVLAEPDDHERAMNFWRAAEQHDAATIIELLRKTDPGLSIPVKRMSGTWGPLSTAWQAGQLLRETRIDDQRLIISPDCGFFTAFTCRALDIPATLPPTKNRRYGEAGPEWDNYVTKSFRAELPRGVQGNVSVKSPFPEVPMTAGLEELGKTSPQTRAHITRELIARDNPFTVHVEATLRIADSGVQYDEPAELDIPTPDAQWLQEYGVADTSYGFMELSTCTDDMAGVPADLLPIPKEVPAPLRRVLGLPGSLDQRGWHNLFLHAETHLPTPDLHRLYACASQVGAKRAPEEVTALYGQVAVARRMPVEDCRIAIDDDSIEHLLRRGLGVIDPHTEEAAAQLSTAWGLDFLQIDFHETPDFIPADETETRTLRQQFPYLSQVVSRVRGLNRFQLVSCQQLVSIRENDWDDHQDKTSTSFFVDEAESRLLYSDALTTRGLLTQILQHVGVQMTAVEVQDLMKQKEQEARFKDSWATLQKMESDEDRVAALLGEDGLRRLIPDAALRLVASEGETLDTHMLYTLAQNIHGSSLWRHIVSQIPGDAPMSEWANSATNKDLTELGFGDDFLRRRGAPKTPAREEIRGPVKHKPLHTYQESVRDQILERLRGAPGENKAIVQLPTGAGKTRVAVESLMDFVRESKTDHQLIVWIAQSEELCEQAADALITAWREFGVDDATMSLSRLWRGNDAEEDDTRLQMVVTTIQTLSRIADADKTSARALKYQWLSDPDVAVIDEAHGATAPSYTKVLRWFKRSTGQRGKPLLGLSATPYRGTSEDETLRLVRRFDGKLIEPEQFTSDTAHEYLQAKGVLARVNQEELEGSRLYKSGSETRKQTPPREPERSEFLDTQIDLDKVARDEQRNHRIIKHITAHRNTIRHAIVFAASVEHAQALAAVLMVRGITAAAIHGETQKDLRRSLIQRFRDGKIQVLTNFDVLSQGFDAPKVDTVYMCRPTFSPNKYVQMIGRGLRGPRNGGSEEVLVVNVKDNLENFGLNLVYNEFDYLWQEGAPTLL